MQIGCCRIRLVDRWVEWRRIFWQKIFLQWRQIESVFLWFSTWCWVVLMTQMRLSMFLFSFIERCRKWKFHVHHRSCRREKLMKNSTNRSNSNNFFWRFIKLPPPQVLIVLFNVRHRHLPTFILISCNYRSIFTVYGERRRELWLDTSTRYTRSLLHSNSICRSSSGPTSWADMTFCELTWAICKTQFGIAFSQMWERMRERKDLERKWNEISQMKQMYENGEGQSHKFSSFFSVGWISSKPCHWDSISDSSSSNSRDATFQHPTFIGSRPTLPSCRMSLSCLQFELLTDCRRLSWLDLIHISHWLNQTLLGSLFGGDRLTHSVNIRHGFTRFHY